MLTFLTQVTQALIMIATVASAVFVGLQLKDSAKGTQISQDIEIIKIQTQLRQNYLALKPELDKLDIDNYPHNHRKYTEQERDTLRRYWTEIVFNEFLVTNVFGKRELQFQWKETYTVWAVGALKTLPALSEEWCNVLRPEERVYFGNYDDVFDKAVNGAYVAKYTEKLDCAKLLRDRKEGTRQ